VGTLADAVRRGAYVLEQSGWSRDDGLRDAEALARHILKWDMAAWLAGRRDDDSPVFRTAFEGALARRLRHEPVAYISGEREFYGRPFRVTPHVLIPRPETELVVDEARALLERADPDRQGAFVVDVGTGSGCIAVTLALDVPRARVMATDISAEALAVAAGNARSLGAAGRVHFVRTSVAAALAGPIDLIVSNPPYVPDTDAASLMPDVRDHEPAVALFGGPRGLDIVQALAHAAAAKLRPGGSLVMEIGAGQGDDVQQLIAACGLRLRHVRTDLAGIPRVLVASRPA
jgi:release factor glutamine methyltransferase